MIRPFNLSVIGFFLSVIVTAQTATPVRIATTERRRPVNLYLHLDKSIYQPNESIWFTGYILNRDADLMHEQNTLYVVLVDPVSRSVISKRRFLIQNGLGKGSLVLPDSIAAGDYWFLGYTNALLETGDEPLFRRLISVRTGTPSPFRISPAKLEEQGDSLFVRYRISTPNSGLASGGKFIYTLSDSTHDIRSGQQRIDPFGEVVLYLGPKNDAGVYRELAVTIDREGISKRFFFSVNSDRSFDETSQKKADAPTVDVGIVPDSSDYHRRSKVKLHIRIRDSAGRPVPGIFSLSVVAARRLGAVLPPTIVDFDRCSEAAFIPQLKQFAGVMPDYGYVLKDNGKVDKPIDLALMGSQFASFQTDPKGQFAIPYSALIASDNEANYLSVAAKSPDHYKLIVYSRADTFDTQLAAIHYQITPGNHTLLSDPDDLVPMAPPAIVKANRVTELDYATGRYSSTHCEEDYVCTHHHGGPAAPDILNCPYMSVNGACDLVKPKEGERYVLVPKEVQYEKQHGTLLITYHCGMPSIPPFMKVLGPILREQSFPLPCNGEKDVLGSGLQSTVYWNHGLTTDANGEMTVSFYTDDLTGDFSCSLQGVSSAGTFAGRSSFSVR